MLQSWQSEVHAGGTDGIVKLNPDHPGFQDSVYRERRNFIAQIALRYQSGQPVPQAPYTDAEHRVWQHVWSLLDPQHAVWAADELLTLQRDFALPRQRIPQLQELNPVLADKTGFRMEPVAGLVSGATFLRYLGHRVFLSTQYIRHYSRPLYTPEPDVVHELVGHAATLTHPGIAEVSRQIGIAAAAATEEEAKRLEHVYWYTLEFGVLLQRGQVRAFGAGLLSSIGELGQIASGPTLLDWDLDRIADTPYDPTDYQPHLFVAPSFDRMLADLSAWVSGGRWRR